MKAMITRRNSTPSIVTWDTFPGATLAPIGEYYISDVGVNGSVWHNNGTKLVRDTPITLYNAYHGVIIPSCAAANAASYVQASTVLTVTCAGHNIPATVHNGKSIYLTPGTPATGAQLAAGLYTNFQYVDANTFTCVSTVSQSGTGAINTQTSAITVPGFTVPVKGNLLGLNGYLDVAHLSLCNATAGTKRVSFLYNTYQFKNPSPGSTTVAVQENHRMQNVNSASKQMAIAISSIGFSGNSALPPVLGTVDSTANQNITCQITLSTALDFITLEHVSIQIQPS